MRIFDRPIKWLVPLALATMLASCGDFQTGSVPDGPTPIPKAMHVIAGGVDLVIAAPKGFCIDRATVVENDNGAFLSLSDCHLVQSTGQAARMPISTILTVSISPTGLVGRENGMKPALTALGDFLATPVGVFTLGKSQVNGAVSILATKQTEVALYLLVQDTAFADGAGVSNRFWRAFTEVNGRLIGFSVTGYLDSDPDEARSLRIIRALVQSTIDANSPS